MTKSERLTELTAHRGDGPDALFCHLQAELFARYFQLTVIEVADKEGNECIQYPTRFTPITETH